MLKTVRDGVGLVLLACVGLRISAWLIEPLLPLIAAAFVVSLIGFWIFAGPRHRGR